MTPDRTIEVAERAEGDKNERAFLKLIRWAELWPHGGQDDSDYYTMFGGGTFLDVTDHPRQKNQAYGKESTAAGAYMFTVATWDEYKKKLALLDFGPRSQDQAAIAIIRESKALDLVRQGKIQEAIGKLGKRWASLPGASQSNPKVNMQAALQQFAAFKAREP